MKIINITLKRENLVNLKKVSLIFLVFLCLSSDYFAQNLKWVNALKSQANTMVKDIQKSPDNSGYYACGYFSNTVDFNPKATALNITSSWSTDAFIAKYNNEGILLWVDTTHFNDGTDGFNKLAVSADGSRLFVCGYSDFQAQNMGYLVARINPTTGEKIWKRNFSGGGFYQNEAQDILADESSDEGVYVLGHTRNGITIDFDPVTPGQQGHTDGGKYSHVIKFNKDAIFLNQFLGVYYTDPVIVQTSLIRGNDGNIYASMGGLWPSVGGLPAATNFVIIKLSPSLSLLASTRSNQQPPVTANQDFIGIGSKGILKLAKDQSSNDIYAFGSFDGTRDLNPNSSISNNLAATGTSNDIFLAKYDATTLAYTSSWRAGGNGNEFPTSIHITSAGLAKMVGYFDGTSIYGSTTLNSNGLNDGFIIDFNSSTGAFISGKNLGGTGEDVIQSSQFIETSSTLLLSGYFGTTTNFNLLGQNQTETSLNAVDGFLAVYKTCIIPNAIQGPANVCRGTDFTLTASATGSALNYQWYKDGVALLEGNGFTGTNTAVLTVNYTGASWGRYKCLISNSCDEAFTSDYLMDLNDGLILHHDYTNGSLVDVSGNSPDGTMNASGFGTDRFGNPSAAFNPTFGQIINVANIPDLPVGNSAYTYSVWVNNSSPNPPAFAIMGYGTNGTRQGNQLVRGSDAGRIDNDWINDPLTIGTGFIGVDSWLQIVCSYDPTTRIQKGVHSYNPAAVYQRTVTNTPNFTASTFKIGIAVSPTSWNFQGLIDEPRMYKRAISALETDIFMNLPNISKQPINTAACLNQETNLTVKGQSLNGPVSYQWYKNGLALTDGGNIAGATTDSLIILNTTVADEGEYFVEIYDACHLILSKKVNVTTQTNTIEITSQPTPIQTVCEGIDIVMNVQTSGATPTSYQWFKNGNPMTLENSSNLTLLFTNAQTAGNYYVEVYGGSCGTLTSETSVVTMKAATSIITQPASQITCSGTDVTFEVQASGSALTQLAAKCR
jgi:hypothetical protein